jgi:crotonobetainyl-CoA:carnitine CoA-transferase CaiB-like acyl-CoA transferase
MQMPLDNILVVTLEHAVAAPFCTSRLADAGARVIKIERADGGDFARSYDSVAHGESAYFVWLNRGKESACLDIKSEEDNSLLLRMLATADVFVQNLSPGSATRAGFDSELLRSKYPQLIICDISGYGEHGSYRDMKAYDLLIQSESGLASITGSEAGPGRVGVSVCDIACGMYAYSAILEALLDRLRTNEGKAIKVSLFDSIAEWMTVPLLHFDYAGAAPNRAGLNHPTIAPYGAYMTADNKLIVIAIQSDREWQRFCDQVLQQAELGDDGRFQSNPMRCVNRAQLDSVINSVFSSYKHADMLSVLEGAGIAFGSVNEVADLSKHPQLRRISVPTPTGPVDMPAPPQQLPGKGEKQLGAVPALGEHSDRIREEFADFVSSNTG